jgi:hypothetical protein
MSIKEVVSAKEGIVAGPDDEASLSVNVGILTLSTSSAEDEDTAPSICLGGTIRAMSVGRSSGDADCNLCMILLQLNLPCNALDINTSKQKSNYIVNSMTLYMACHFSRSSTRMRETQHILRVT